MGNLSGRKRGRALSGLVTAAIATALVGTASATASADVPAGPSAAKAHQRAESAPKHAPQKAAKPRSGLLRSAAADDKGTAAAPQFDLYAADRDGLVYLYMANGHGGFKDAWFLDSGWQNFTEATQVDHDRNGESDGWYVRHADGQLEYTGEAGNKMIGSGWNAYDRIFSPGDLGGAGESDLLARDKSGVMWIYLARPDGTLTDRYRVGPGWDQYTDITGRGDLNGDGKADIVAKDRNGDLWFYKGTGDYKDPFESRVKVGGGWNMFDKLVGVGDLDHDGRSDMLARDKSGVLWLYKGNGNQSDPFENRTKIGPGWGKFNLMF
ncbi:FG-GAP-like repeat-containing protein [Streptomyces abikoensis]|uniref:FG-GAP-like repeat-containing protein n=1 Tax=Streptomyces abikoensis TaxID=97398 RepID=UPI0033EEEB78